MVVECNAASEVKQKLLAARTPLLSASLLHVHSPSDIRQHGVWVHIKGFQSYKRLKVTQRSCMISSLLPGEVGEKAAYLH